MPFATVRQTWITAKALLELRRNERLTRAQLEARKLQKFRRLVIHAARNSPYYAEIIRERRIEPEICAPEQFPVLTKTILMANFDQIVTDRRVSKSAIESFLTNSSDANDRFLGEYQVIHTSGSSGEVGYFVYSLDDWAHAMAQFLRTNSSSRLFRKTKVADVFACGGHYAGVSMAKHWIRGHGKFFLDLLLLEINSPVNEVIDRLNAQQPHVLGGYNTALKLLAAKQREGTLHIAPESVVTGGEPASPADMADLKTAFGGAVFNNYGSSEHLLMGVLGPQDLAMTLFDDDLIYEPFEDHTVVTNLFNFTLPLIRYRMSEVIRRAHLTWGSRVWWVEAKRCPCLSTKTVSGISSALLLLSNYSWRVSGVSKCACWARRRLGSPYA
jgi:phenylacetate-CoA ligase